MAELARGDDNVAHLMGEDLAHPAWKVLGKGHDEHCPTGPAMVQATPNGTYPPTLRAG